jgi:hypothetical protein
MNSVIVMRIFLPQKVNINIILIIRVMKSQGKSVSIVSDYGLNDRALIPSRGKGFSSSLCIQTSSGAHQASYPMGTRGKAQLGCDADHSPPSSVEVKEELYLLCPNCLHGM